MTGVAENKGCISNPLAVIIKAYSLEVYGKFKHTDQFKLELFYQEQFSDLTGIFDQYILYNVHE